MRYRSLWNKGSIGFFLADSLKRLACMVGYEGHFSAQVQFLGVSFGLAFEKKKNSF